MMRWHAVSAPKPRQPKLVAGVDFYMQDDRMVFTALYLLKRGHCCNSGCRHCPYRDGSEIDAPVVHVTGLGSGDGTKD